MSDENKIRDAADAVKGIVEAVPVYQDALQPAAREMGAALETIAKTVHVALAPLSALVWGYDRIKDYLSETLTQKLKDVPPERIITPNPTVAGPAVEALRFAAHEPTLRDMYANLLAAAMDSKTAATALPAYVEILKQLSPDEAKIMKVMRREESVPVIHVLLRTGLVTRQRFKNLSLIGFEAGCNCPELAPLYLNNLIRLGLISVPHAEQMADQSRYAALYAHEFIASHRKGPVGQNWTMESKQGVAVISTLGKMFHDACVSPDSEESPPPE